MRAGQQEGSNMTSNGKVALVTGGGSGIGKASALALAREGFAVVVAGRRPEPLDAVVSEIESMQSKALGVPTDVGNPASVEALFAKANGETVIEPTMDVENVARSVVLCATVTPEANIQFLTVMATKMPFVGRG